MVAFIRDNKGRIEFRATVDGETVPVGCPLYVAIGQELKAALTFAPMHDLDGMKIESEIGEIAIAILG